MTWDQDQVDSFIKGYNWTNFEQKSCRMSTSIVMTLGYPISTVPIKQSCPIVFALFLIRY